MYNTVWKLQKFTLSNFMQKFCEINLFSTELHSILFTRNIFQARVNFSIFHTVYSKWRRGHYFSNFVMWLIVLTLIFTPNFIYKPSNEPRKGLPFVEMLFMPRKPTLVHLDSKVLAHLKYFYTVLKFQSFPGNQILCEINIREYRSSKSAIFCNFRGPALSFLFW